MRIVPMISATVPAKVYPVDSTRQFRSASVHRVEVERVAQLRDVRYNKVCKFGSNLISLLLRWIDPHAPEHNYFQIRQATGHIGLRSALDDTSTDLFPSAGFLTAACVQAGNFYGDDPPVLTGNEDIDLWIR